MRLKNFKPAGNQVLAQVQYYNTSTSGVIHKLKPEKDMFAEVIACGPAVEHAKPGDLVMFGDIAVLHLPFEDAAGKQVVCIMTNEFNILAYYEKEKDETRIFVPDAPTESSKLPSGISVLGNDALGEWASENEEIIN